MRRWTVVVLGRLGAAAQALWPVGVANYLNANYKQVEREIGVDSSTDFITDALYTALRWPDTGPQGGGGDRVGQRRQPAWGRQKVEERYLA